MIEVPWPSPEAVSYWSGLFTIGGFIIAIIGIFYAARQFWLARKAASVATFLPLLETLSKCWEALDKADGDARTYRMGEWCNSLEIATAVFRDRMFAGSTRELLRQYLVDIFKLIQDAEPLRAEFSKLVDKPTTFQNIRWFLRAHCKW